MFDSSIDGYLQIVEIDWLGNEIESTTVHRRPNVLHVAVGRNDDGMDIWVYAGKTVKQRKTIHFWHIDISQNKVDIRSRFDDLKSLDAIAGEFKLVDAATNLSSHALTH